MIIVGKAIPGNTEDDLELSDFRRLLTERGCFAYAWTFNPKRWAMEAVEANLCVWLYLIRKDKPWRSRLRMSISSFRHSSRSALACPHEWRQYAPQKPYADTGYADWKNTGKSRPIHLWFLVDSIEDLDPDVDLRGMKRFFAERLEPPIYREYTENSFAFLRSPGSC